MMIVVGPISCQINPNYAAKYPMILLSLKYLKVNVLDDDPLFDDGYTSEYCS